MASTLTMTDVSFTNETPRRRRTVRARGERQRDRVTFENNGEAASRRRRLHRWAARCRSQIRRSLATDGPRRSAGGSQLRRHPDARQRHVLGQRPWLDPNRPVARRRSSRTRSSARASLTGAMVVAWCREGGPARFSGRAVGAAITDDEGNNFDEDGHCGFDGNEDIANVDPHLASIADNGGPTRTLALLAASKAIGNGNPAHCPGKRPTRLPPATAHATSAPSRPTPRRPRDPDHQRGRPRHRLERRPSRDDQPLG